MDIGGWCLEDCMGGRYNPKGKIGKGLGFGAALGSGASVGQK